MTDPTKEAMATFFNEVGMTREQANAKITELKAEIDARWEEIEELAKEHNLTVYGPNKHSSSTFYPNKQSLMEEYGWDEDEVSYYAKYLTFPGWVSSGEFC